MSQLRTLIKSLPFATAVYKMISRAGEPDYWISKAIKSEEAVVVQVGSNDGKTGDPVFRLLKKNKAWRAVLVEPVPFLFERLKSNYKKEERFTFENVAINDGTEMEFFWVDKRAKDEIPDLPYWYDQLGSFNKQHILDHLDGILEPYIISEKVPGVHLEDLLGKHKIKDIDILHIDTEGWDWKILSQLNFNLHSVKIILFEFKNLSIDEKRAALSSLEEHYGIFDFDDDVLCINKNLSSYRTLLNSKLKKNSITKDSLC